MLLFLRWNKFKLFYWFNLIKLNNYVTGKVYPSNNNVGMGRNGNYNKNSQKRN